jgi:hypothetical protein
MEGLGLQCPCESLAGDPATGVDAAECLIRKIPLSSHEPLGLANGPLEWEMFEVLQRVLGDEAVEGPFGGQDPRRMSDMRPQALPFPFDRLSFDAGTKEVKPPERLALPTRRDISRRRVVALIGDSAHELSPLIVRADP